MIVWILVLLIGSDAHVPCGERARLILAALELSRKP